MSDRVTGSFVVSEDDVFPFLERPGIRPLLRELADQAKMRGFRTKPLLEVDETVGDNGVRAERLFVILRHPKDPRHVIARTGLKAWWERRPDPLDVVLMFGPERQKVADA